MSRRNHSSDQSSFSDETIRLSKDDLKELHNETKKSTQKQSQSATKKKQSKEKESITKATQKDVEQGTIVSDHSIEGSRQSNPFSYQSQTERLRQEYLDQEAEKAKTKGGLWETAKLTISELIQSAQTDDDEGTDDSGAEEFREWEQKEPTIVSEAALGEVLPADELVVEEGLQEQQSEDEDEHNIVAGTAWLTLGKILSRVIGALYVIPWATWLGSDYPQASALYSVGYKPYSLFLAIATAGFPSAIAKQMAYYHSKEEYRVADRLFKYSLGIMLVTGIISSAALFLLAPSMAQWVVTDNPVAATLVIRSLAPALLILPLMSLFRGYFQGFNDMIPTAVSEILEQFARVIYLLAMTYAVMKLWSGDVSTAVMHSTFAAFVGALLSLGYLLFVYLQRRQDIQTLIERSKDHIQVNFGQSVKIMLFDSLPFILLGSGIIIAQNMDSFSLEPIMLHTSTFTRSEITELYGAMSLDVDKLIMIIIAIAVALSTAFVPSVTAKFAQRDYKGTSELFTQIIKVFSFVMLPAALGMAVVSTEIYQLFYAQGSAAGPHLLRIASLMSVVLGLYTVLSTLLQSMNFRKTAVFYLFIGLVTKALLQYPLVAWLGIDGAIWSTTLGFAVSSGLMWMKVHQTIIIPYDELVPVIGQITLATLITGANAWGWTMALNAFGPVGRLLTLAKLVWVVLVSVFIYACVMGLFGQLGIILGDRYQELQEEWKVW